MILANQCISFDSTDIAGGVGKRFHAEGAEFGRDAEDLAFGDMLLLVAVVPWCRGAIKSYWYTGPVALSP